MENTLCEKIASLKTTAALSGLQAMVVFMENSEKTQQKSLGAGTKTNNKNVVVTFAFFRLLP